jgi:hypothetical protein
MSAAASSAASKRLIRIGGGNLESLVAFAYASKDFRSRMGG